MPALKAEGGSHASRLTLLPPFAGILQSCSHRKMALQVCTLSCRFSSDIDTIDDDLPFIMNIFLSEAFEMLGTLVVLVISQPILAAAFVPLAFIYRWIQVCRLQSCTRFASRPLGDDLWTVNVKACWMLLLRLHLNSVCSMRK